MPTIFNPETDPDQSAIYQIRLKGQLDAHWTDWIGGMIGAWVHYLKRATTKQERVLGFAKDLVCSAFLVYALLMFLEKK